MVSRNSYCPIPEMADGDNSIQWLRAQQKWNVFSDGANAICSQNIPDSCETGRRTNPLEGPDVEGSVEPWTYALKSFLHPFFSGKVSLTGFITFRPSG